METKQETKPFPADSMAGLLANRTEQGNERTPATGNEDAGQVSRLSPDSKYAYPFFVNFFGLVIERSRNVV